MIDEKNKILVTSIRKLIRRGATQNIKKIFVKTHAADIAEVFEEMDSSDALSLFPLIPGDDKRAEVLSHLSDSLQKKLVQELPQSSLVRVLNEMDNDDTADLLGQLDEEISDQLLSKMDSEEKEEVEDLLKYPEDSAGGLMTPEILAIDQSLNVQKAIEVLQKEVEEAEATFYIYVVDEDRRLVGVLSLKQLILSKPTDILRDIMIKEVVSVDLTTDQQDVATVVERYDFLSVPVVDEKNELMGAITVDDVIDVIREEALEELLAMGQTRSAENENFIGRFRSRYPWLGFAFLGGLLSAFIILKFSGTKDAFMMFYSASIPVLLMMGVTISNQVVTLVVNDLRVGRLDSVGLGKYIFREFQMSLFFGVLATASVVGLSYLVGSLETLVALEIGAGLVMQLTFSSVLGVLFPWLLRRLQLDPAVGSLSLTTVVGHLMAVLILFSMIKIEGA